jgi:hypothetical protein
VPGHIYDEQIKTVVMQGLNTIIRGGRGSNFIRTTMIMKLPTVSFQSVWRAVCRNGRGGVALNVGRVHMRVDEA